MTREVVWRFSCTSALQADAEKPLEKLSDGKTKFIVRIHIWGLFRLGSCHLRQRTGEKVLHRILQFTQREKGCHKHKAYFVSCTDLEWDYPYIPATKEMDKR